MKKIATVDCTFDAAEPVPLRRKWRGRRARFRAEQCVGDIAYAEEPCDWLPFIEDVDHTPLEVLSPKDGGSPG